MKQVRHPNTKKLRLIGLMITIMVVIACSTYTIIKKQFTPCSQFRKQHPEYGSLPIFSIDELAKYDGVKNEKTYVGFHCVVYDVTEGKNNYYADGKGYHYLVGRDATKQLDIFGGDIIESKYPKVGLLNDE